MQGQQDSPLTERGKDQAVANGRKLNELLKPNSFRLISSPLGRCMTTAELIATCLGYSQRQIETDDRLQEVSFGRWEGKNKSEIKAVERELYYRRNSDRWSIPPPGGESYSDVALRLSSWRDALGDETIVAISHGGAGRILRGLHCSLSREKISQLEEPHDRIFLLTDGGEVEEFDVH